MTNRLYNKAVEAAMTTRPMNLLAGNIKAQLVDLAAYTPNFTTDEFLAAIPSGARIGAPVTLTGKSVTNRVFDAADTAVLDLVGAPSLEAVVIYESTGSDATSPLIVYNDTATGLPVSAGATSVNPLAWDDGANKIFKL